MSLAEIAESAENFRNNWGTETYRFLFMSDGIIVFRKASSLQPLSPSLFTCSQENPHPSYNLLTTLMIASLRISSTLKLIKMPSFLFSNLQ